MMSLNMVTVYARLLKRMQKYEKKSNHQRFAPIFHNKIVRYSIVNLQCSMVNVPRIHCTIRFRASTYLSVLGSQRDDLLR